MIFFLLLPDVNGQDSLKNEHKNLRHIQLYGGIGYGATLLVLSQTWYADKGFDTFSFFNDNAEWKQMDKVGHIYSTYHLSRIGYGLLEKTHLTREKSLWWSSVTASALLLPIEILDGFSPDFGFSYGDIIAKLVGSGFFLGQELLWREQRLKLKFSFHQTSLAPQRPELLGQNILEEILKDYNGQTYWLSADISAFLGKSQFPQWLNLAIGYGAQDMIFARDNQNEAAGLTPYRQLYLGIDLDLSHIETNKKWLKTLLFILDGIKIPGPTLSIGGGKTRGHLLYY